MKHQIEAVKKFHEVYKLSYKLAPIANIGKEKINLRFNLMSEENKVNEEVVDAPEGADVNLEGDSDAPESIGLKTGIIYF